ncbi:hypothetical protein [Chitinophaga oryzae]|uniref:hypothetical protein n=1 Tax=Chitinophaga oryzae TaxID=2725414 RepID=UPI0014493A2E|nr:hypothetical protein [Chitinophaga oryzae]
MVPWAVVILPALALLPLSVDISSKFTALNFSVQRSDYLGILLSGYLTVLILGFTDFEIYGLGMGILFIDLKIENMVYSQNP